MTQIITEVVLDLGHIDKKEKRVFAKGLYEKFLRTNKNPNPSIHAGLEATITFISSFLDMVKCWASWSWTNVTLFPRATS